MARCDGGHLDDAPCGLGTDHAPLAAHQIVVQRAWFILPAGAPPDREAAQNAEEDHGEEVVDQRRVPARQKIRLQGAIVGGQLVESPCLQWWIPRSERAVQPLFEPGCHAGQAHVVDDHARRGAAQPQQIEETLRPGSAGCGAGDLVGKTLPHPHHLFHEAAVEAVAGEQGDDAVPVEQVVVDAAPHQPEHAAEGEIVGRDPTPGHAQETAELAVDPVVGMKREAESQGGGDTAVALDDVRVVPDGADPVGVGPRGQGGDRPRLEEEDLAAAHRPFDVLGPPEVALGAAGELGDARGLPVGKRGLGGSGFRDLLRREPFRTVRGRPVRQAFRRNVPLEDRSIEVDAIGVGVGVPADQRRSQTVERRHHRHRAASRHRVGAEGDSGGLAVDHHLHQHGRSLGRPFEVVLPAVGEEAFAETGSPYVADPGRQALPGNGQIALELAGKGVLDSILLYTGRAHRDEAGIAAQPCEAFLNFIQDLGRRRDPVEKPLKLILPFRPEQGAALGRRETGFEGARGDNEPGGDLHPSVRQQGEGRRLASHAAGIDTVRKRENEGHPSSRHRSGAGPRLR